MDSSLLLIEPFAAAAEEKTELEELEGEVRGGGEGSAVAKYEEGTRRGGAEGEADETLARPPGHRRRQSDGGQLGG